MRNRSQFKRSVTTLAILTTSRKTPVSLEGMLRGVLYLTPLLLLVPFLSWNLEAGQRSQSATTKIGQQAKQTLPSARYTIHRKVLPSLKSASVESEDPTTPHPIKSDSWLAAFHRTNEFVSAQVLASDPVDHEHDVEDWQFSRKLPLAIAGMSTGAPDRLLPVVNPIARLAFFAPPTDDVLKTVMLDPGHGGSDPGTIGANGLLEKHLTLDIAKRVQHLLAVHPNINVALTRQDDKGYSRHVRMLKVQAVQPDILISLHLNNLPQKNLTLVESFYASHNNIRESERGRGIRPSFLAKDRDESNYPFVQDSRRLANLLQEQLFHQVSEDNANAINAGTKQDTLFMLTRSYLPATLIELTCLSNREEEERLKTPEYRQDIAIALAKGILEFFATENSPVKS